MNKLLQYAIIALILILFISLIVQVANPIKENFDFTQSIDNLESIAASTNAGIVPYDAVDSTFVSTDNFDSSYWKMWRGDVVSDYKKVVERSNEIIDNKENCIDFINVNQCMSQCQNSKDCTGFYVSQPNTCCMLIDPNSQYQRTMMAAPFNNLNRDAQKLVNSLARNSSMKYPVFNKLDTLDQNSRWTVPMNKEQCFSICPKCIYGRCPQNYKCVNVTANVQKAQNCIITNQDKYNENTGFMFDSDDVPYLNPNYQLNQYAGYDDLRRDPVTDKLMHYELIGPDVIGDAFDFAKKDDMSQIGLLANDSEYIAIRGENAQKEIGGYSIRPPIYAPPPLGNVKINQIDTSSNVSQGGDRVILPSDIRLIQ